MILNQVRQARSNVEEVEYHQYLDGIIAGLKILDGSQEGWGDIYAAFIYCRGMNIALAYYDVNQEADGSETITRR